VVQYWKGKKDLSELVVGGDEFLPIFTLICIKAAVPNLPEQSGFMEKFISEVTSISQGGYLLATLQTCLSFMCKLEGKDLEQNALEVLLQEERKERKAKQKLEQEALKASLTVQTDLPPQDSLSEPQEKQPKAEEDLITFD